MNSVTQDMAYRQSLMKYAEKYGVGRASRKYNRTRSYIYFWKARWDGTAESLACRSRRPHSHPNQHTPDELKLIQNLRRRNPNLGLPELWHRLRQRGYSRRPESLDVHLYSLSGIGHLLIGLGLVRFFLGCGGRQPQPAQYPKQVVPRACITDPEPHLFQYTASVRRQTQASGVLSSPGLLPSAASVRRQTQARKKALEVTGITIRCLRAEADPVLHQPRHAPDITIRCLRAEADCENQ